MHEISLARGLGFSDGRIVSQDNADYVHATKLTMKAVDLEGDHPEELADCLYLAAMFDLAAGKEEFARSHLGVIAQRFPGYNPEDLTNPNIRRNLFVRCELVAFKSQHSWEGYDSRARGLLEEERLRCGATSERI